MWPQSAAGSPRTEGRFCRGKAARKSGLALPVHHHGKGNKNRKHQHGHQPQAHRVVRCNHAAPAYRQRGTSKEQKPIAQALLRCHAKKRWVPTWNSRQPTISSTLPPSIDTKSGVEPRVSNTTEARIITGAAAHSRKPSIDGGRLRRRREQNRRHEQAHESNQQDNETQVDVGHGLARNSVGASL